MPAPTRPGWRRSSRRNRIATRRGPAGWFRRCRAAAARHRRPAPASSRIPGASAASTCGHAWARHRGDRRRLRLRRAGPAVRRHRRRRRAGRDIRCLPGHRHRHQHRRHHRLRRRGSCRHRRHRRGDRPDLRRGHEHQDWAGRRRAQAERHLDAVCGRVPRRRDAAACCPATYRAAAHPDEVPVDAESAGQPAAPRRTGCCRRAGCARRAWVRWAPDLASGQG